MQLVKVFKSGRLILNLLEFLNEEKWALLKIIEQLNQSKTVQ